MERDAGRDELSGREKERETETEIGIGREREIVRIQTNHQFLNSVPNICDLHSFSSCIFFLLLNRISF